MLKEENDSGSIHVYHMPRPRQPEAQLSHVCDLKHALKTTSSMIQTGSVTSLAWYVRLACDVKTR